MAKVTQEFQSAPMGRRVVFQMVLGIGGACVAFAVGIIVAFERHARHYSRGDLMALFIGPFLAIALAVPAFLRERSRVSKIRIEENVLVLGKQSYPLEGLVSAERDSDVLRGARRTIPDGITISYPFAFGKRNLPGKFSSIQGTYKSKRLGKFYAFLTGTEHAVLLRWPDRAVAVSPADTEFFIYMVRLAAGLR
jgi:hypothetical protein